MLHGLGDTCEGWASVAPQLALPHVKWIFPTAPTRPITINMGAAMPGWFDLTNLDPASFLRMLSTGIGFDPAGVNESVDYVKAIIEAETKAGIAADRIVVGGFSQGGHIAIKTCLTSALRLGGCVSLSTWMEPAKNITLSAEQKSMPIFQGHGSADPMVPAMVAQQTNKILGGFGYTNVDLKLYSGMGHSSCPEEMADFKTFLNRVIPGAKMTADDINRMSIKQLKAFLSGKGVSTRGMLEKSEFRAAALQNL
jgi:predicted esterase